jgi:D-3-phosphoglycerate dehydrogenase / 2-oxoglutarate reductase
VGSFLGKIGVNIRFMSVAPLTFDIGKNAENEALMILGLDKEVGDEELKQLMAGDGIISAVVVTL